MLCGNCCIGYPLSGYSTSVNNVVYADYNAGIVTFVTSLYSDCLSRTPDSAGLDDWCSKLASGQISGKQAAHGFFFSSEFQTNANSMTDDELIDAYYKVFLNRAADPSGKAYWAGQIAGTTNDISILFTGFADSTEFADKCASYGITADSHVDVPETTRGQVDDGSVSVELQSSSLLAVSLFYDSLDNLISRTIYQYDEQGNLIREITEYCDNTETFIREYQYDGQRNLIQEACYVDGRLWSLAEHQYDVNGNRISTHGRGGAWIEYQYNDQGVRSIKYDESDGHVIYELLYDQHGNLTRRIEYNDDGSIFTIDSAEYQYDAHGNLIRETQYNDRHRDYIYTGEDRIAGWVEYQYSPVG